MTAQQSMEQHREHGGTDQTWATCHSCLTARRAAERTAKAPRPARASGVCRRCGTYCYGDCTAR